MDKKDERTGRTLLNGGSSVLLTNTFICMRRETDGEISES